MGTMLIPLIVIGGMMFFMTRSQKKQQNQRQELLNSMSAGDSVVTIGGLHGVISEINTDRDTITIDCEGIYLEFDRNAIKSTTKPTTSVPVQEEVSEVEDVEDVEVVEVEKTDAADVVEEIVIEEEKENQ